MEFENTFSCFLVEKTSDFPPIFFGLKRIWINQELEKNNNFTISPNVFSFNFKKKYMIQTSSIFSCLLHFFLLCLLLFNKILIYVRNGKILYSSSTVLLNIVSISSSWGKSFKDNVNFLRNSLIDLLSTVVCRKSLTSSKNIVKVDEISFIFEEFWTCILSMSLGLRTLKA